MADFTRFLLETGVLRFGDFTLKSGKKSPYFLNFGEVRSGRQLARMGSFFAQLLQQELRDGFDVIYGPPYKGIPMGVATCQALWSEHQVDSGFLSYRKEQKAHGEGGDLLGHQLSPGERVVLIDDVMTSGGTKLQAIERLKALEPSFVAVVVGVDREERDPAGVTAARRFTEDTGIPVVSLLTVTAMVEQLEGLVPPDQRQRILEHVG